ncbi:lysylphosphatidylglycerol synthase transmembrane domain-containing protein [Schlesneria paludicola]|uniref:lysylphosphatidylglycerol synthase transmembrane domain-containing protein n=1 Tax=Schlesneria paludicola TaxID=360056 RepID=UPI00029A3A12|nr:lysylphosphatidylglycerol synthase transmembrane domain-containing protein [Schlesneria paludicola]
MTATPPNRTRAIVITSFKWLLAIGLLAGLYVMCGKDLAKLKDRQILWGMFGAALLVRLASLMATFTRWRLLVRGTGLPFSLRESFRLGMLGEACNLMGPGAVGGDLIKAALLAKDHPKRIPSVLATVFLDRVLGMWALFVLGALASLSPAGTKPGPELQWAVWVLWGGAVAGLFGIGLMFVPAFTHSRLMHWLTTWRIGGRIVKELMDSVQMYQGKPQIVIGAALLGLAGHFGFLTSFYFCALSLHHGQIIPGFIDHIVGLPLPEALSAAVPTPGGVGALEGAVAWFYQQAQKSLVPDSTQEQLATALSNGVLTALGYRLTSFVWGAVGVVYYLSSRQEIRRAAEVAETQPVAA